MQKATTPPPRKVAYHDEVCVCFATINNLQVFTEVCYHDAKLRNNGNAMDGSFGFLFFL